MLTPVFHILTPDAQYADDGIVERRTAGPDVRFDIYRERQGTRANISDPLLAAVDALVVWHEMAVDRAMVEKLRRCRVIVRAGVGFDHIDLEAAGSAGIPVCNTPDYGTSEVADHAIALMLAFSRGIVSYHEAIRRDPVLHYDVMTAPLVRRIRGRVFGIVGIGRIGTAAALRAKAFGMRVIAYDPYAPAGVEIALGVDRVETMDELLATSDVVSLHAPLTETTRGMIDARALATMKSDAVLINTARGALVDIPALLDALAAGTIRGAGIDVLAVEPPDAEDGIVSALTGRSLPSLAGRLIVTPHAAWFSPESREDARRLSVETAMLYLRQGRLRNLVNGEYLTSARRMAHA
jgi:phosphoglycerate dehydrogenase-like enzyme